MRLLPDVVEDLRSQLQGNVILPEDPDYHPARRLWNGMIEKYPALIVRCRVQQDVVAAIHFAQTHQLLVAIRSGGHSSSGSSLCDDGMVIDLSAMKSLSIDPAAQTARVEPGLTIGELIQATQTHQLGLTIGTVSGTGIAGLTLGGGIGWLMGKHGLTVDNLLSVDLVSANGQTLSANADENPDLFRAVRGGGGNFGVVTSFLFQLHKLGPVLGGIILYPMPQARAFLRFYRELTATAPDEFTAYAAFVCLPGEVPAVGIAFCYCGEELASGERLLEPLRSTFGPPLVDTVGRKSYNEVSTMLDAGARDGWRYYEKGGSITLSDEAITTIIEWAQSRLSPLSQVLIQHVHGAVCRVDPTATAISSLRGKQRYNLLIVATWTAKKQDHLQRDWAQAFWQAILPYAEQGSYINFLGNDAQDRVASAYADNYAWLVKVKTRYDPQNFFRCNYNILPQG